MATLRQRTSFGPGVYRGHRFDLDRLRSFVEGTNRAIAAGVPIPLLLRHAPINADDAATEQFALQVDKGAGWITKVEQEADGSIAWEADAPQPVIDAANAGTLKFTSPEFRNHYESEKAGVYSGPIIRHFAFTPQPGNPHQGAIESIALEEGVWQFEESDVVLFAQDAEQFAERHVHGEFGSNTYHRSELHNLIKKHGGKVHSKGFSIPESNSDKFHADTSKHGIGGHYKMYGMSTAHSERADDSYTGSLVKPTHDLPNTLGKSEGKSIDWDTLAPHIKSQILDAAKAGKNTADIQKLFGVTGAVASKAVEEWNKSMSQHAEFPIDRRNGVDKRDGIDNRNENAEIQDPTEDINEPVQSPISDNPDMPPKATDKSKLAAIIAGLKLKGMCVPSDWNPDNEGAMDILLATLNTAIDADNRAEAEDAEDNEQDENVVQDAPMPFAEHQVHSEIAQAYGYHPHGDVAGTPWKTYAHKRGHITQVNKDGSWWHTTASGRTTKGKDSASLHSHMASSQHTEQPTTGDYVMQFTETKYQNQDLHDVALKQGYKRLSKSTSYTHPKTIGHLHLTPDSDNWQHNVGGKITSGKGHKSLTTHLAKYHSSQHTETQVGDYVIQFTEEELATMPASVKAKLDAEATARKAAEARALQFEEGERTTKNTAAKDKAVAFIESSKLPAGMKIELLTSYDDIQFEEGLEQPVYTNVQVAGLFSKYIPKHLQFDEDDVEDNNEVPKGSDPAQFFEGSDIPTGHVSAERARELVNSNPHINNRMTQRSQPLQSVSDLVAAENQRVPNNVMKP